MLTIDPQTLHQPQFKFEYDSTDLVAISEIGKATSQIIRDGIYTNIPQDIYNAMTLPSAETLWLLRKESPNHYFDQYLKQRSLEQFDTNNFVIAFRLFVLNPMKAIDSVIQGTDDISLDYKNFPHDKIVLWGDNFPDLMEMVKTFFELNRNTINYKDTNIASGINNVTLIWTENGIKMRGRVDRIFNNYLHSLKTAGDVNTKHFNGMAKYKGFEWEMAILQRAWLALTGEKLKPLFTAVERQSPYASKYYRITDAVLEKECENFTKILDIYKYCTRTNDWFSYSQVGEYLTPKDNYFNEPNWFDYVDIKLQKDQPMGETQYV